MKRIAGDESVLRREAAGVHDHQPLRDRVDGQRDDHRRQAQIGHPGAVDQSERDAACDAEGSRASAHRPQPVAAVAIMPPTATTTTGEGRGIDHDRAHPVRAGREERGDLQLLQ
jgi:hypothetical protein